MRVSGPPAETAALMRCSPMPGTVTQRSRGNDRSWAPAVPGSSRSSMIVSELVPRFSRPSVMESSSLMPTALSVPTKR